ncbi:MAG: helix-turn-helix domain-containing protein [Ornithinimicrobium sp.]
MAEADSELATQLNHLFATIPQPDGTEYTNKAAAEALTADGVHVSAQHLWHLRTGRADNPSFKLLAGVARLFGVPIAYFSDPEVEAQVQSELATLAALREAGVKSLLNRAHGVSPQNMKHIEGILDQIRRVEGLDATGPEERST